MQPLTKGYVSGIGDLNLSGSQPRVSLEGTFTLAVGPGYPTDFTVHLSQIGVMCDPNDPQNLGWLEGEVRFDELSGATETISGALTEDGIGLEVHGPGSAELSVAAEMTLTQPNACNLPEGSRVGLDLSVAVVAIRPAGARFVLPAECRREVPLVAPDVPSTLALRLVDEQGEAVHADNATQNAQVGVVLREAHAASDAEPSSLADWFPTEPGIVELFPAFGEPLQVDVLAPDRITESIVEFQLAGRDDPLERDGTYGEEGWDHQRNRVAPRVKEVRVDGVPLCSAPTPSWFELESHTPEACAVEAFGVGDAKLEVIEFDPHSTGESARLKQDGKCSLTLRAPEFGANAGLPLSFSATFRNVQELDPW